MSSDTTSDVSEVGSGPVEPDSTRIQQLQPGELVMDANVRHDARVDHALIASVRDHGVLQPIIAVATGDGRARVRFGHRRTLAAIAAGLATVPVIVGPSNADADAAEIERLSTQTVENTHREGLSTSEQLDVFAQMAAHDLTAGQIATRTKSRRRDVVAGLKAARLPEVREAVASAGLTLEQGAALEEFSDDPEAYETLLERATNPRSWGPGFDHTVQRLRDARAEAAAREVLLAELAEAGTPVIDQPMFNTGPYRLIDLTDDPQAGTGTRDPAEDPPDPDVADPDVADPDVADPDVEDPDVEDPDVEDMDLEGPDFDEDDDAGSLAHRDSARPGPITPQDHAACPGHAAYLTTTFGGPRRGPQAIAVHVCTDPLGHGHRLRSGAPLRAATAPAAPRGDETAEQAAERVAAEKAAKAAARKRVIAGNKAWDSATTVRRGWLAEMLTRKTPPKGAGTWMAQAFLVDRYTVCRAAERGHATAAELLCPTPGASGQRDHERILAVLAGASENRATVITLGMVLGAIEGETGRHQWRWGEQPGGRPDAGLVAYLQALVGWGYALSPIERLAIGDDVDDADVFDTPTTAPASPDTTNTDPGADDDTGTDTDAQ